MVLLSLPVDGTDFLEPTGVKNLGTVALQA